MTAQNTHAGKPKHGTLFYVKKMLMLIIGALITAAGLELFLIPNNVIDGGVVGLSIMSHTITGMTLGTFLVIYNIPFIYMGYKQIGKSFALSSCSPCGRAFCIPSRR